MSNMVLRFTFFILFFGWAFSGIAQSLDNSELSSGNIYKVAITENGIYKIDADLLNELGVNTSSLNPENIKVLGYGGGMLPQSNAAFRYQDLVENPVKVQSDGNSSFDNGDYILFYGQGADKVSYNNDQNRWVYEKNLYADTAYYFLKISDEASKKISTIEPLTGATLEIRTYDAIIHHEIDEVNHLDQSSSRGGSGSGSGRRWFGERFDFNVNYSFNFDLEGAVSATPIKLSTSLMSSAPSGTQFEIATNQNINEQISIASVPETTYGIKGRIAENTFVGNIQNTDNLQLTLTFDKRSTSSKDAGYLDYFTWEYQKQIAVYGNQSIMRFSSTIPHNAVKLVLPENNQEFKLWDVTDIINIQALNIEFVENNYFALLSGNEAKELVLFSGNDFPSPLPMGTIKNQNLRALAAANLLVIVPEFLRSEAERLADFRRTHDGLSVEVATTAEIYNEFSSGKQDITAIRDFIRHIYLKNSTADSLKYVLLFGDGSYDYKNRKPETATSSLLPIYESYESLHPIYSYSSDDYFAFMDETEGAWTESFSIETHLMDVGIGRLPVNSLEEARAVVDKLIRYATAPETLGKWRKNIVFVADDGDANTHQLQADRLGRFIEGNYQRFNTNRIFVDAFEQVVSTNSGKRFSPEAKAALEKSIDNGVFIMNFTGHGAETGWTSEDILTNGQIINWENNYKMPLMVTATCEFGRYDNPTLKSGAEFALLNPNGGAIALLTTTRPVFSNSNFDVNSAFYRSVFDPIDGKMPRLGDVLVKTKNDEDVRENAIVNRNFALLGDPSMRLAYPSADITVNAIKNGNGIEVDTIKSLDIVQLTGEVQENGFIDSDFNGVLEATVYDKSSTITTFGDEGPNTVMEFEDRLSVIYRGRATVKEGNFSLEFIVPKNIDYTFDEGKISLYAKHNETIRDAAGSVDELLIGGSSENFALENNPPQINTFIENEQFANGDLVPENTVLYIDIFDESGINITGNGIGQQITAILDEDIILPLNDFYTATIDDYQNGRVSYPLQGISSGLHTISVKVWDNQNNLAEQQVIFRVGQESEQGINNLLAFPNPFESGVRVSCFNAFQGEQLEIQVAIYDATGKLTHESYQNIANSTSNVNIVNWNGKTNTGEDANKGLYLIKCYLYYPKINLTLEETLRVTKY